MFSGRLARSKYRNDCFRDESDFDSSGSMHINFEVGLLYATGIGKSSRGHYLVACNSNITTTTPYRVKTNERNETKTIILP